MQRFDALKDDGWAPSVRSCRRDVIGTSLVSIPTAGRGHVQLLSAGRAAPPQPRDFSPRHHCFTASASAMLTAAVAAVVGALQVPF